MAHNIFEDIYKDANIPVIVCENNDELTVLFANSEAYLLLNPSMSVEKVKAEAPLSPLPLRQLVRFSKAEEHSVIRQMLSVSESLGWYLTSLLSPENEAVPVKLSGNIVRQGGLEYAVIYIFPAEEGGGALSFNNDVMAFVLNTSYHATDIDSAISLILSRVGEYIGVSRVYIFEDLFNNYTRNTYEWCAPGVLPAIQELQNLCKDDYSYETIADSAGMFITDDVSALPEKDRAILEPQGIKSLAILPLFHRDTLIGYIGYDDCKSTRRWSHDELAFLKGVGSVISSLINRRNAEAETRRSREVLQTISDNIDSAIYVSDINSYELKFANRTLAAILGTTPDRLIGKKCWQVLKKGMSGPCLFCPMPKLLENGAENAVGNVSECEQQNMITGGWYWVKDSVIRWADGNLMHFQVAIDITLRKQFEEQLRHYASTDALTGVFNREWGLKLLCKEYADAVITGAPSSLCFIDIDGLKYINDVFGHPAGDKTIITIAKAICRRIRHNDMICRWGGDEFIVLFKCPVSRADSIIRSIQEDLRERVESDSAPSLSFSYGISDFSAADSVDSAISAADVLMYRNKSPKQPKITTLP